MINLKRVFTKYNTQIVSRVIRPQATNCEGYNIIQNFVEEIEAVVTMASASDLNRFTDATTYIKSIKVTTRTPLNGSTEAFAPDIIIYMGESFIVQGIDSYEAFGYCRAVCSLSDYVVQPGA